MCKKNVSWQNPNFYSLFDILLMWYARKRANLGNKYIPSRLLIIELLNFANPIRLDTFQMILFITLYQVVLRTNF